MLIWCSSNIIINAEDSFKIFWSIESSKDNLFETEVFCNNVNISTVTFDQSLLNNSINFLKKQILTDPKFIYVR